MINIYNKIESELEHDYSGSTFSNRGGIFTTNSKYNEKALSYQYDFIFHDFASGNTMPLLKEAVGYFVLNHSNNTKSFFRSFNTVSSYSLFTGERYWVVDLSNHGEIRNLLGVVDDKLWISMYRGGISKSEKSLLSIDINNGDILFELPKDYTISDVHIKLLEHKQTILSIYSKWSTAPADSPFVEIDALTNKVLRSGRIESIYNKNLKIASWQVLGNKIFFTANKDFLNATHIGVLDYNTFDLLWVTEVLDRKAGLKDLQVTEDKIYVLDMGGTLHIYEKI